VATGRFLLSTAALKSVFRELLRICEDEKSGAQSGEDSLCSCSGHRLLRTKFLPLFCSGVGRKAGITLGRLMKFSRYGFHKKKNTAHAVQAKDFVG